MKGQTYMLSKSRQLTPKGAKLSISEAIAQTHIMSFFFLKKKLLAHAECK